MVAEFCVIWTRRDARLREVRLPPCAYAYDLIVHDALAPLVPGGAGVPTERYRSISGSAEKVCCCHSSREASSG